MSVSRRCRSRAACDTLRGVKTLLLCLVLGLPVVAAAQQAAPAPGPAPASPPARVQGLEQPGALRLEGDKRSRVRFIAGAPLEQFYPPDALSRGEVGTVIVDLLIDIDGRVMRSMVLSETPAGKGFGDAAREAVGTFQFANGLLRPVLMSMQIRFGKAAE